MRVARVFPVPARRPAARLRVQLFVECQAGETEQRIYALSVWRDTPFFDEQERAILALTEEVTLIANHVSDETYNAAAALFDKTYLAQIIMAIININSWNRIGIALAMQPSVVKQ